nr:hypothetical protein [Tanacetum cinerariifolium]
MVKPEIDDDVEFEINSNFMRELRRKIFKGSITAWDLLEIAFIRQYCLPFKTAKKLEEIRKFKEEMGETLYHAWERYGDLLYRLHITPPDDDYVAPANPIFDMRLKEFGVELFDMTENDEKADGSNSKEMGFGVTSTRIHVVKMILFGRNHFSYK